MIFLVSFLGALFAILTSLLIVYTYIMLRVIPRLKKGVYDFVAEHGPKAAFAKMEIDPMEAMREFGVDVVHPSRAAPRGDWLDMVHATQQSSAAQLIYTCEDHGRCAGCPKILAQFAAIIKHQGKLDEIEQKLYDQLRAQLASDDLMEGEGEADRQKRIAGRIIETLVREGTSPNAARGAVWGCAKEARATFANWLSAARQSCEKEKVA